MSNSCFCVLTHEFNPLKLMNNIHLHFTHFQGTPGHGRGNIWQRMSEMRENSQHWWSAHLEVDWLQLRPGHHHHLRQLQTHHEEEPGGGPRGSHLHPQEETPDLQSECGQSQWSETMCLQRNFRWVEIVNYISLTIWSQVSSRQVWVRMTVVWCWSWTRWWQSSLSSSHSTSASPLPWSVHRWEMRTRRRWWIRRQCWWEVEESDPEFVMFMYLVCDIILCIKSIKFIVNYINDKW